MATQVSERVVLAVVRRAEQIGMLNMTPGRARKILEAALAAASDHPPATVAHHADRDLDRYVWRTRDDH